MAHYGLARMADEVSVDDDEGVAYFAYSAARVTTLPTVYASVSAGSSSLSTSQRNVNARYIFSYLRNWGFTKEAACGVLGNISEESNYDPGIWNKMNNINSAYGLVQWKPARDFLEWAVDEGVLGAADAFLANSMAKTSPAILMNAELAYLVRDGDGTVCKRFYKPSDTGSANYSGYEMTYAQYKKSTYAPETLAAVFCDHFERLSEAEAQKTLPERKRVARQWFKTL